MEGCHVHRCRADMSVHEHGNSIQHLDRGGKACLACCSVARAFVWDVKLIVLVTDSQDTDIRKDAKEDHTILWVQNQDSITSKGMNVCFLHVKKEGVSHHCLPDRVDSRPSVLDVVDNVVAYHMALWQFPPFIA